MRQLTRHFKNGIPFISILVAIVLESLLFPIKGYSLYLDKLVLFFWLIYRPDLISFLLLSLCYFLLDIIQGWPLGFNPALMLGYSWFVLSQRHWAIKMPFAIQWLLLAGCMAFYLVTLNIFYLLIESRMISFKIIRNAVLGCLIYPFISQLLYRLHIIVYRHTRAWKLIA